MSGTQGLFPDHILDTAIWTELFFRQGVIVDPQGSAVLFQPACLVYCIVGRVVHKDITVLFSRQKSIGESLVSGALILNGATSIHWMMSHR